VLEVLPGYAFHAIDGRGRTGRKPDAEIGWGTSKSREVKKIRLLGAIPDLKVGALRPSL